MMLKCIKTKKPFHTGESYNSPGMSFNCWRTAVGCGSDIFVYDKYGGSHVVSALLFELEKD